jgi:hypothetical protein
MKDLIKELRKGNKVHCEDCFLYLAGGPKEGLCRRHIRITKNHFADFAKGEPSDDACADFVKK